MSLDLRLGDLAYQLGYLFKAVNQSLTTLQSQIDTANARIIPARNYVPNGRIEFGTTGFAPVNQATISSSNVRAYVGTNSLRAVLGTSAANNGIKLFDTGGMPVSSNMRISCRVFIPSAQAPPTGVKIQTTVPQASATTTVVDQWVRLTAIVPTTSLGYLTTYIVTAGSTSGQTFYVDDIVVTEGESQMGFTYAGEDFVNVGAAQTITGGKTFSGELRQTLMPRVNSTVITANTTLTSSSPGLIFCNNSSEITVTLPNNAGIASALVVKIIRTGAGNVIVSPPSGGTINSLAMAQTLATGWAGAEYSSTGTAGAWFRTMVM